MLYTSCMLHCAKENNGYFAALSPVWHQCFIKVSHAKALYLYRKFLGPPPPPQKKSNWLKRYQSGSRFFKVAQRVAQKFFELVLALF